MKWAFCRDCGYIDGQRLADVKTVRGPMGCPYLASTYHGNLFDVTISKETSALSSSRRRPWGPGRP